MTKQFKVPFATQGDWVSIPDEAQSSGAVSYAQGYGSEYERDPNEDITARNIEREKMNGIFHDITGAVGEIQTFGASQWAVEGQPYPLRGLVYHKQKLWQSRIDNNKEEPKTGNAWVELKADLTADDVGAYSKEESDNRFQSKGNYQPAGKYALEGESYTKPESDTKYQSKGNYQPAGKYALEGESYTKPESDTKYQSKGNYQPAGKYALEGESYTKPESDTKYQSKGNYQPAGKYALEGESYTKPESDTKYQSKGNYQPAGKYALEGESYTKPESDAKYQSKGNYQPAGKYALEGESYTKPESDTKYQSKGNYQPAGKYALEGESYTKPESDTKYQSKGNYQPAGKYALEGESYTKAESDERYQSKEALKNIRWVPMPKGVDGWGNPDPGTDRVIVQTLHFPEDVRGKYLICSSAGEPGLVGYVTMLLPASRDIYNDPMVYNIPMGLGIKYIKFIFTLADDGRSATCTFESLGTVFYVGIVG